MKKLIFDLDFTLYSPITYPRENVITNNNDFFAQFYDNLKPDLELGALLKQSKHNYVFTNGNENHMDLCLKKMRIKSQFNHTISSDQYNGQYKPHMSVYLLATERFNLRQSDDIFFFEDAPENLKTAKKLGWTTIFLDHSHMIKNKPQYMDYVFDNIYDAIKFLQSI